MKDADARRLFSPQVQAEVEAKAVLLRVLGCEPRQFGYPQSRWSLQRILESCPWLQLKTLGGLSQLLKRLGIRFKRARDYVHSPDPDYLEKLAYLEQYYQAAQEEPERVVFLYLDEFTYQRQPTLARAYAACGHQQVHAARSHRSDTQCRGIAVLNALTGQVLYRQYHRISLANLSAFYQLIRANYPQAETIYVAQDNWPVHVHPQVLATLQPQASPFWPRCPHNWPTEVSTPPPPDPLPIQLLFLPTYASWLNPIEKLWRWLRQDLLHLHPFSDDWQALQQAVIDFMLPFAHASTPLLRYTGLLYD